MYYKSERVYENDIKNNPMFWSYFFHYAFCQKHSVDICQEIIDFAELHYPLEEAWAEEFARPKTDPEKMTAPKANYVRQLAYSLKGSLKWNTNFNIHYIRFYQDKIVYSGTIDIENAKKESLSRMSFQIYKKAVRAWGPLSGILLIPMVYVKEEEMPEFKNLIRRGFKETAIPPEDYDALESLMFKYCMASEEELKENKLSLFGKYWRAGAIVLSVATVWFGLKNNYSYIGESGLYATMVHTFSCIPLCLYFYGGALYFFFVAFETKEEDRIKIAKKRVKITVICTAVLVCVLVWGISDGVLAVMDVRNLKQQMAKVNNELVDGSRVKPWTWEGLEEITLENPKVHISRPPRNALQFYHTISASNIRKRFKIPDNTSWAEYLQKYIDNGGGTIIVFYYEHSRVVERICNEEYGTLWSNTIYYLPESFNIPHH